MKRTIIARSAESLLTHDRSQLHVISGLRNAIAVFIALLFGVAIGQPALGLGIAIGAQVSGFAGLNGTIRKRLQTMILAALWMGLTTFISGEVGGSWMQIPLIAVLGFIAGFMGCVSNEAGLIGMWATIAFILFSWFPHQGLAPTIVRALLVIVGGILQAALMLLIEAVYPSRVEEKSISQVYHLIAKYIRDSSRKADLQVAGALQAAWSLVQDSAYRLRDGGHLEAMLNTAESIRIEVIAVQGMLHALRNDKVLSPEQIQWLEYKSDEMANFLDEVASALQNDRSLRENALIQRLNQYSEELRSGAIGEDWKQIEACLSRAAKELLHLTELNEEAYSPTERIKANGLFRPTFQIRSAYGALRANFTPQSGTFRHAVRLAAALTAATLLYQVLPFPRGYWLPLTTLVVLRPEFATTFSRGVARVLGTLLGAVLATFVLLIPDTQHFLGAVLVSGLLWGMYTVLNYNLFLFSGILTAEVVVLLSFFAHGQPLTTIDDRVTYTILGGVVAFAAYFLWPTWLHLSLPDALAKLFAEEQAYVDAVFHFNGSRQTGDQSVYRKRTRLARTNAANQFTQALGEPASKRNFDKEAVSGVLTAIHRLSEGLLSLESHFSVGGTAFISNPDVVRFGQYVHRCLEDLELMVKQADHTLPQGGEIDSLDRQQGVGALDEVSPYTKQELRDMEVPASLRFTFIRMEDNLGTMFRMLAPKH